MQKQEPLLKRIFKKLKPARHKPLLSEKPRLSDWDQMFMDGRLMRAAERGDIAEVRRALKKGANIDASVIRCDHNDMTPLMKAAQYGHTKICELLIENGANIEAVDDVGKTALIYAAWWNHLETCRLLIENGASMATTTNGINAFTYTHRGDEKEKTEFLLRLMIERMAGKEAATAFISDFRKCLAA
jgi:hypothetical protein